MSRNETILQRMTRERLEYLQTLIAMNQRREPVEQQVAEARQLTSFPNLQLQPKTIQVQSVYSDSERDATQEGETLVEYFSQVMSPVFARQVSELAKQQQAQTGIPLVFLLVDNWSIIKNDLLSKLGSQRATPQVVYKMAYNYVSKLYSDDYQWSSTGDMTQFSDSKTDETPTYVPPPSAPIAPIVPDAPSPQPAEQAEVTLDQEYISYLLGIKPPRADLTFNDYAKACITLVTMREFRRAPLDPETKPSQIHLAQSLVTYSNLDWRQVPILKDDVFEDGNLTINEYINDQDLINLMNELAEWAAGPELAPQEKTEPVPVPTPEREPEQSPTTGVTQYSKFVCRLAGIVPVTDNLTPADYEKALRNVPDDPADLSEVIKAGKANYKYLAGVLIANNPDIYWKDDPALRTGVFKRDSFEFQQTLTVSKLEAVFRALKGMLITTGNGIKSRRARPKPQTVGGRIAKPGFTMPATPPPKPNTRIVFNGAGHVGKPAEDFVDRKKLARASSRWPLPGKPTLHLDLALLEKGKLCVKYDTSSLYRISPSIISPGAVRVVTDVISGQPWDQRLFDTVPDNQQRLIEKFVGLMGKANQPAGYPGNQATQNLFQEHEVCVGQIGAGNDSPKIRQRLREIILEMVVLKTIPASKARQMLSDINV